MSETEPPYKSRKRLIPRPDHGTYDIGHGKPPVSTRFKPGKSGNPKGRPKGKKTSRQNPDVPHERLKAIFLEEAYRKIKVNDGPSHVTVPMAQAVVRSLAVTAAKGNTRAQKLFSELLSQIERASKQEHEEWLETAIEYKTVWELELNRRQRLGIDGLPDPVPHPDDIIIDLRRNTIRLHGPMDKNEQADLDNWLQRRHENELELKLHQRDLEDSDFSDYIKQVEQEIVYTKRILEIINTALSLRASPGCIQRRLSQIRLHTPEYLLERKTT